MISTKTDFFEAIKALAKADNRKEEFDPGTQILITNEEIIDFCEKELDAIERKNKRSNSKAKEKRQAERAAVAKEVIAYLEENGATLGKTIRENVDISPSMLTAVARDNNFTKEKTKDGVVYGLPQE